MNSREYYSRIEGVIKDCPIITHFSIDFDEIDEYIGYLKGRLELIDGSFLYFIEFIEIQNNTAIRLKYKYQWQSDNGNLITRWDNVPHHPDVDTFPDHKHDDRGVHESRNMDLETVTNEIMDKIIT
jgi:hypothetical protein